MVDSKNVSHHYTHGNLTEAIIAALSDLGSSPEEVSIDDLAPVDEFHIGGRPASIEFLGQLEFSADYHVLDVGCGLGGPARFAADRYGCRLTGIDLTAEYIETGRTMTDWVGLGERVSFQQGSALAMPFEDSSFSGGYMLHVGMNIADKATLFSEVYRVLEAGAKFGVYDVMRTGDGDLSYPVPWATTSETSAVAGPEEYKSHLQSAGFGIVAERNRREFALDFFARLRARAQTAGGPPALGLHILMGRNTPDKVENMIANISAGRIAPVEIIAQK
jgi:SAM-dependent methyltransferase